MNEFLATLISILLIISTIWISATVSVVGVVNLFDLLNLKNRKVSDVLTNVFILGCTYLFSVIQLSIIQEIIAKCFMEWNWNPLIAIFMLVIYVIIGIACTGLLFLR